MSEVFPPPDYITTNSSIDGIEVFKPTPQPEKVEQKIVEFSCPQCGASTAYSVADGGLTCSHCGYYEAPTGEILGKGAQEFEFTLETMEMSAQGWGAKRREIECQNCGARTSIPEESLTHTCAFCGSNKVIHRNADQNVLRPRFLIPFRIEAIKCREIAKKWLGSDWMVPSKLTDIVDLATFTGVFLPFWTFDSITSANWKAEVGHTKTERYYDDGEWKTRTVIVWRWESGSVKQQFDDILVKGTDRLSSILFDQISGYDLNELTAYDPNYLAGIQAKSYDLDLEQAWEISRQEMREQTRQACRDQASTPRIRNFSMQLDYGSESWRFILLPVYLASYMFASKSYQVLINGQSGEIAGQRPVDWTKVWLVIASLLSPGLFLGLIGLVTLPFLGIGAGIGIFGFILLVVGIVIGIILFRKAHSLDDA